jgi:orotate phosphoribosyltransferase
MPGHEGMTPDEALAGLAGPRRGHYDLGTGFHGNLWLDLDALFSRPALLRPHVRRLADDLREYRVDAVCGPMEGGALLGYAVADVLEAAFLPAYRDAAAYRLPDAQLAGWRVAIVDDAVNAGTAAAACGGLLREAGAIPVAVGALLGLGPASGAVAAALSVPFHAVAALDSQAWPAEQCPLCANGVPLTGR